MGPSFSKLPGGPVRPSRVVTLQADNTVVECSATAEPWGISQPSTDRYPLAGWDLDGLAGRLGGPAINVYGPGDDNVLLELGATVTVGARIKSGAAGVGILAGADGDKVIAIAQRAGVSGDLIPVKPIRFDRGA